MTSWAVCVMNTSWKSVSLDVVRGFCGAQLKSVHRDAQSWKPCVPSFSEHVLAELHEVSGGPIQILDGSCGKGHERPNDKIKEDVAFRRKWAAITFHPLFLLRKFEPKREPLSSAPYVHPEALLGTERLARTRVAPSVGLGIVKSSWTSRSPACTISQSEPPYCGRHC
jgi:hypothetical protein